MTAIEWLEEQLKGTVFYTPEAKQNILEQAKEMEKGQIIDAYDKGSDVDEELKPLYGTPEQYYNETYNK